jgi:hypothetical protein
MTVKELGFNNCLRGIKPVLESLGSLEGISLVYCLLPWILFIVGWISSAIAAALVVVLLIGCICACRAMRGATNPKRNVKYWLSIAVVALLWSLQSGAGGYGPQTLDWEKHNAILKSMVNHSWPVTYLDADLSRFYLVYYFAYYLPAALIGKYAGWNAANHALFCYTFVGTFLTLAWFLKLLETNQLENRSPWLAVPFLFYGGLASIGHFVLSGHWYNLFGNEYMEWWLGYDRWEYQCNEGLLIWVPHQALAAWILTSMIIHQALQNRSSANVALYWALGILWSPLVSAGMLPFLALAFWQTGFKQAFSFPNLVAAPLLTLVGAAFFLSHSQNIEHGWQITDLQLLYRLVLFYLVEVGLYAVFVRTRLDPQNDQLRVWWWVSLICAALCPLYRIGHFSDFTMRASIPAVYFCWVVITRNLIYQKFGTRKFCLIVLLTIGALPAAWFFRINLLQYQIRVPLKSSIAVVEKWPHWFLSQYAGNLEGPLFKTK